MMRVFPDTGVLLAMVVFPRDRSGGISLAGEVLQCYEAGAFDLVIGQAVVDELDEVLDDRFTRYRPQAVTLLKPFARRLARRPTPAEIASALPFCADPADAPIFASAILARPDIVLSNDFEAFHALQAKTFWQEHHTAVESLYGLLCVLGRRKRKDAPAEVPFDST